MRHTIYDPDLLQRIRLEIAASRDGGVRIEELPGVDAARLRAHVERLFYAGELAADARIDSAGLHLTPKRLTPYGVLAMHAGIAKSRARRAV